MDKIYDVLDRAYGFLFETGRTNGNWNEVRSTSLAGMCIDRLPSDHPYWRRSVRSWLESEQLKDGATQGSWGEEIWDTSMALLSLKSLGAHNHDPNIQQGLDWIAGKYSLNGRGNWHDDPWETSWALIAIIASGKVPQNVDVLAPIKWLSRAPRRGRPNHLTAEHGLFRSNLQRYSKSRCKSRSRNFGSSLAGNEIPPVRASNLNAITPMDQRSLVERANSLDSW